MVNCEVSAQLLATQQVLAESKSSLELCLVWVRTTLEVLSVLLLVQFGQIYDNLSVLAIVVCLQIAIGTFVQYLQSVSHTGQVTSSVKSAVGFRMFSLFAFFPPRYSAFGLFRKQASANCFYLYSLGLRIACFAAIASPFALGLYTYSPSETKCRPLQYSVSTCRGYYDATANSALEFQDLSDEFGHSVRDSHSWALDSSYLECGTSFSCSNPGCLDNPEFNNSHLLAIARGGWRTAKLETEVAHVFCQSNSVGGTTYTCYEPHARPISQNVSLDEDFCRSAGLPPILMGHCRDGSFDILQYTACQRSSMLPSACLSAPIACLRVMTHPMQQATSVAFALFVGIPSASLVLLIALMAIQGIMRGMRGKNVLPGTIPRDRDLQQRVRDKTRQIRGRMELLVLERSRLDRLKLDAEFCLLAFDLFSDVSCLAQFIYHGHVAFAIAQAMIVVLSLASELLRGSPCALSHAVLESRRLGFPTDKYLSIVRSEKTIEAPLSLLLQYYCAFYLNETPLTFLATCASMILSIYGVTKGAYEQLHLALAQTLDTVEQDTGHCATRTEQPKNLPPIQVEYIGCGLNLRASE